MLRRRTLHKFTHDLASAVSGATPFHFEVVLEGMLPVSDRPGRYDCLQKIPHNHTRTSHPVSAGETILRKSMISTLRATQTPHSFCSLGRGTRHCQVPQGYNDIDWKFLVGDARGVYGHLCGGVASSCHHGHLYYRWPAQLEPRQVG